MKQCILGDIHGRTIWKRIVEDEKDSDRFIFIGDYLDTHEDIGPIQQADNLQDIIDFKKSKTIEGKEVILLVGNHCYHYWPGIEENYSGYQPRMRPTFEYIFKENKDLFQLCFEDEYKILYSHAGFTETFVNQRLGSFSVKQTNDIWKYKPTTFSFYPWDRSGCGDDIRQGPLWVRPQSLYKDTYGDQLQVIGHTGVSKINHPAKSERRGFYLIDALAVRQYLVCVNEQFEIKQLDKSKEQD